MEEPELSALERLLKGAVDVLLGAVDVVAEGESLGKALSNRLRRALVLFRVAWWSGVLVGRLGWWG